MNVSIGFPIVFFFSFGLTPPGYLAFFYCSTHRNVLTGHRICFFLLFFLASIVSIGLPVRPALLSLRLCLDSVCPLSISNQHPDLTRLLFVFFSLFFLLPSSVSPRSWTHFGSFWLNSHDFCSSFHFIFSLPSRVYSRKIPKTRLRDFSQGSSDPITFSFSFTRYVYIFIPSARFGFCGWLLQFYFSLWVFSRLPPGGSSLGPTFFYLPWDFSYPLRFLST